MLIQTKIHQFRSVSSYLYLSLTCFEPLGTMWWEWHVCKIWQSKVPLFLFVRWGYASHKRLSDAIALLPSSRVASKHCRNMAQRSTLDLSTPENLWASSLGKTSEGLDWLGTLSIHEIKFKRSSVWQTCLIIRSIWSLLDLHFIRQACTACLSVRIISLFHRSLVGTSWCRSQLPVPQARR